MIRRINKFLGYILKEILVKYIFCYVLAIITFLIPYLFTVPTMWENWLISLSVSLISVPIVFIIYTLYNNALNKKSQIRVSYNLEKEINDIFSRYVYFTQYFYHKLEDNITCDEDEINKCLKYEKDEIFRLISDNTLSGVFLFSEFDRYDEYVFELINRPLIIKYADTKEVALLFDFINAYKDLKRTFNVISESELTPCGKYTNIDIQESQFTSNSQGEQFYDALWILDDSKCSSFYSAMYPLFEKDKLVLKFKVTGNKAKEITELIFITYGCIRKWLKYRNKSDLNYENAMSIHGRMYLDCNLRLNNFMDNNFAINEKF